VRGTVAAYPARSSGARERRMRGEGVMVSRLAWGLEAQTLRPLGACEIGGERG
jgi:hypothetical protein